MAFSPTPSGTIQRPDLGLALAGYDIAMASEGYISQIVLPVQEVQEAMGNYGFLPASELAQDHDIERAAGGGYKRGNFKFQQSSYQTEEYGFEVKLDARFAATYAYVIGQDKEAWRMLAAQIAHNVLLLGAEKRAAAAVFNATTFTSHTTAVGTEWSTLATSDPEADIAAAVESSRAVLGKSPGTLIISDEVARNLRRNAKLIAKLGADRNRGQKEVQNSDLASVLGLDRVIIGKSMRPTHAQGDTAGAYVDIWDDEYAMLCDLASPMSAGSVAKPGLGLTMHWGKDGSQPSGAVETYWNDEVRAEVVRVRHQMQEKILHVPAGWLLSNITA